MKYSIFLLFIAAFVFPQQINAQHNHAPSEYEVDLRVVERDRERVYLGEKIDQTTVLQYLDNKLSSKYGSSGAIIYDFHQTSSMGSHWVYRQTLNGLPIYMGKVKINIDKYGSIIDVLDLTYSLPAVKDETEGLTSEQVSQLADSFAAQRGGTLLSAAEQVVYIDHGVAHSGIKLEISLPNADDLYILGRSGEVLYKRDIRRYCPPIPQDSLVSMMVFDPDPLTSAMRTYGAPYLDSNDEDIPELNDERVLKTIRCKYENNQFLLENDYIKIAEFDSPSVAPVTSNTPSFSFTRSEQGFEDVNAYYHLTTYIDYVQGLGCGADDLFSQQIQVDTHGANGDDNSFFRGIWPNLSLIFGEGNVDDAEDADVLIHELGHAISYYSNRNNNSGGNRQSIDEGIGDYFAASYSRSISEFRWAFVFSWDGHNSFFAGRKANTAKAYPGDLVGDKWLDGELVSSAFMDIWDNIGREETDKLVVASLANYFDGMEYSDVAYHAMQADLICNNGANCPLLFSVFSTRGMMTGELTDSCVLDGYSEEIELRGSQEFFTRLEDMLLFLPESTENVELDLFNTSGQLIRSYENDSNNFLIINEWSDLPTGVYIVSVRTDEFSKTQKVMKYK